MLRGCPKASQPTPAERTAPEASPASLDLPSPVGWNRAPAPRAPGFTGGDKLVQNKGSAQWGPLCLVNQIVFDFKGLDVGYRQTVRCPQWDGKAGPSGTSRKCG